MNIHAQTIEIAGRPMVILPQREYFKLRDKASLPTPELNLPKLPAKGADGGYPAAEYIRVSIAREIIRRRRSLGLPQAALARRAGLSKAYLCRVEKGHMNPTVKSIAKIDAALKAVEKEALAGNKARASA
jgi:ribosome-binding protein aMBF1 (putative translation factor)